MAFVCRYVSIIMDSAHGGTNACPLLGRHQTNTHESALPITRDQPALLHNSPEAVVSIVGTLLLQLGLHLEQLGLHIGMGGR